MDKERIIAEIRRTAEDNGGVPLGQNTFADVTGIGEWEWRGKYWRNWGEAVLEAGLTPNQPKPAHGKAALALALTRLTAKLGRFPTRADLKLEKRTDPVFPTITAFDGHIGRRAEMVEAVRRHATEHSDYRAVLDVLPPASPAPAVEEPSKGVDGAVYMLKLGKHYKIGKSFRVPQRHREIAIELPEKPDVVHVITTDDPTGIEAYWHARFAEKRTNGEWFALTQDEIRAFKRRKFM
jgi:Meiotically up-regulated gene 113